MHTLLPDSLLLRLTIRGSASQSCVERRERYLKSTHSGELVEEKYIQKGREEGRERKQASIAFSVKCVEDYMYSVCLPTPSKNKNVHILTSGCRIINHTHNVL